MSKQLNIPLIEKTAEQAGLSQTAIAEHIGKTKAAVSKWFTGKSFPRPPELLKLGRLLQLPYKELVHTLNTENEPLVAFRKRASCLTTPKHINRAKDMGHFLEPLVDYLQFDKFVAPPRLKSPTTDYRYLQDLVRKIRHELELSSDEPIKFEVLIKKFNDHQAVLVPTMQGRKERHENALHIFLPKSQTTWIFLNLDVEAHDFKFWMAHELGHVLSVDLLKAGRIDEAEDFADGFAGALIFPESAAEKFWPKYSAARSDSGRIKVLTDAAETYEISPYSVYKELQKFAPATSHKFVSVEDKALHTAIACFNKNYKMISENFFDDERPSADRFVQVMQGIFGTHFYHALGEYLKANKASPSAVSRIMDVSLMDAKAFHEALTAGSE